MLGWVKRHRSVMAVIISGLPDSLPAGDTATGDHEPKKVGSASWQADM